MKFWIALVGYNPREGLWSQAAYLAYVVVFFSLWGFAVLALLANQAAWLLSLFGTSSPVLVSAWIMTIVILVGALWRGYKSTRVSPFVFGEDDAVLICQTPLDRRQVALAWMLGDWIFEVPPYLALAVVLKFAAIQLLDHGGIQWARLPGYGLAGLRVASVVLFIHLALSLLTHAIGALRLRGGRDMPAFRLVPAGLALLLLIVAFISHPAIELLTWPVRYPLEAGVGLSSWLGGICVALLLVSGGWLAIYFSSARLSLSRAAQESRFQWAYQQVSWLGSSRFTQQMKLRRSLGSGHRPSRLAGRERLRAVAWKDWVMAFRAFRPGRALPWVGILLTSLGMVLPLDWGAQLWAFILWVLLVGQRLSEPLRDDLGHWAITRQLPFRAADLLAVEITGPMVFATLLGWLAIGVGAWLGGAPQPIMLVFIPLAILGIALVAVNDVIRQCHSSDLLAGEAPEMGFAGLLLGAIVAAIPLVLVPAISSLASLGWVSCLVDVMGFGLSLAVAYGLWKLAAARFRKIN